MSDILGRTRAHCSSTRFCDIQGSVGAETHLESGVLVLRACDHWLHRFSTHSSSGSYSSCVPCNPFAPTYRAMGVLYQVYLLTFRTVLGTFREYVGMTKVADGATPGQALQKRRRWHISNPVAWRRCADMSTVHLRSIGSPCAYDDALADEALAAASRITANPRRCRGGPWCVPGRHSVLLPEHARQVKATCDIVAAGSSQAGMRRALRELPGRALHAHLDGRNYVEVRTVRLQNSGCRNRELYASSVTAEKRYVKSAKGKAFLQIGNIV